MDYDQKYKPNKPFPLQIDLGVVLNTAIGDKLEHGHTSAILARKGRLDREILKVILKVYSKRVRQPGQHEVTLSWATREPTCLKSKTKHVH